MYGERIKEMRLSYELSREELAKQIMTTPLNIKLWEEEKVEPTINDLIVLANSFETTVDWIIGVTDEDCEEDHECKDCEEFLSCKLLPHMNHYMSHNDDPAYIHVQLALNDKSEDCVVYSGRTNSVLSAMNLLLTNLAAEMNTNYYDLVALMASVQAKSELEDLMGDE